MKSSIFSIIPYQDISIRNHITADIYPWKVYCLNLDETEQSKVGRIDLSIYSNVYTCMSSMQVSINIENELQFNN